MKKRIFILLMGLLLIGSSLFAGEGDFIVEGNVGIGTDNPGASLDVRGDAVFNEDGGDYDFRVEGDADPYLFSIDAGIDAIGISSAPWSGATLRVAPTDKYAIATLNEHNTVPALTAMSMRTDFIATANRVSTVGLNNQVTIDSNYETAPIGSNNQIVFGRYESGTSNWTSAVKGLQVQIRTANDNLRNFVLNGGVRLINLKTSIPIGTGTITGNNLYGIYAEHFDDLAFTNHYGAYFEKQTGGTNNYGIVLNGDGAGADIVLGLYKETKIYGNAGNFIIDTAGKVGIGNNTPVEKLEVAGAVKIAGTSSACDAATEGTIRYDSVSRSFEGCDGQGTWKKLAWAP